MNPQSSRTSIGIGPSPCQFLKPSRMAGFFNREIRSELRLMVDGQI